MVAQRKISQSPISSEKYELSKNMSCEELYEGILGCYRQFYSGKSILKRIGTRHVSDLVKALLYGVSNIKFMNDSVPWIIN